MRVDFAAFWLHKAGAEPRHYEDAFAPASVDPAPRAQLRCAVADGATESAYARVWARQLAGGYASGRLTAPGLAELPVLGRRWLRSVTSAARSDAWYLERKVEHGAFAALVGLELRADTASESGGTYEAVALGDSCVVQVRDEGVRRAFPLVTSAAFGSRPTLVPSRPSPGDDFAATIATQTDRWRSGDAFYLMSDALACWFLAAVERGERPWAELNEFAQSDRAGFRQWVRDRRASCLKNDDVTLLRLVVW